MSSDQKEQDNVDDNTDIDIEEVVETGDERQNPNIKKRERKEREPLISEPGKSLLPLAKFQKILKADKVSSGNATLIIYWLNWSHKELPIVAKEASFLISLATEDFIRQFCQAAQEVAQREGRSSIRHSDIGELPLAQNRWWLDLFQINSHRCASERQTFIPK